MNEQKVPVQVNANAAWLWHDQNHEQCTVAYTDLEAIETTVSTVFFIRHMAPTDGDWDNPEPTLFESYVFGGQHHEYVRRYRTWSEAEQGHKDVCRMVLSVLSN